MSQFQISTITIIIFLMDDDQFVKSKGYFLFCGSSVSSRSCRLHLETSWSSCSSASARSHTSFCNSLWRVTKAVSTRFPLQEKKAECLFNFNSLFFQRKHSVLKLTATECCFLTSWKLDGSPPGHWLCHICAFSGRPGLATPSSDPPLHQPTGRADLESAWWSGSRRCRNAISPLSSEELDG